MDKNYGSWSLKDLKSELSKRNAKTTGKKAVLVQRLEDYDKIFGPLINNPDACYKMTLPGPENFKDVTSTSAMPIVTKEDVNIHCELADRNDKDTSENMYKEGFLISCRSALQDSEYFVTAQCASEMRKTVIYNIAIKAQNNVILESQCECAAGMGPYGQCKHIIVLLFGLIDFSQNKSMVLKRSCTSQLQTFHHPSTSYTGNPVKAENLTLKFKNEKMQEMVSFDPRLCIEDQDKYKENFISLIANYCGHGNSGIPIAQIIKPADKKSIFHDHDYLEKSAEEMYFESLILNQEELKILQSRTERKEWLQERKIRLPSSDFKKICCCTEAKKGNLAQSLLSSLEVQTAAIKHGRKYENIAIQKFQEISGLAAMKCGIIVHPEYQFLGSTPDALIGDDEILEVKCPYTARHTYISGASIPYIYLCEISGKFKLMKNHEYYYQVQGQLFCSRRRKAYFCIYTFCDFCVIEIEKDEDFIQKMVEKLQAFYNEHYKQALLDRYLYSCSI